MRRLYRSAAAVFSAIALTAAQGRPLDDGVPVVTSEKEQQQIIERSCAMNSVATREPLLTNEIFVDYRVLRVFLGFNLKGTRTHWRFFTESDIVDLLLLYGWKAVETQKNFTSLGPGNGANEPFIRFELLPAGSAACRNWRYQYEYPLSHQSALRQAGVSPDQCVGITELPLPSATGRIDVLEWTKLFYNPKISTDTKIRLKVRTGTLSREGKYAEAATVVMHLHRGPMGQHGSGDIDSLCPDNRPPGAMSAAEAIGESLRPDGSYKLNRPSVVVVPSSEEAVRYEPAGDEQLARVQWLKMDTHYAGGRGFYGIDARGVIWTNPLPAEQGAWALFSAQNDRILVAKIPFDDRLKRFYSTFAFGRTQARGYVVVTERSGPDKEARFFEYDSQLRLVRALTLTPVQLAAIVYQTL